MSNTLKIYIALVNAGQDVEMGEMMNERYTNADLKISYMFGYIQKQYPENFAFLLLRILELFTREVCKFIKK